MANTKVTSRVLADDAVLTANITDANVTTAKIANDAITGAKIADDAINSEHYTDGSIDTAHIADDQVTLAKMAGLARGKIIYGDSSGNPAALAVGSNGQVLKSDGTDISWGAESTGVALDDISTGDAATTLATSAGNITIDAQGSDTDIIFKGTDGSTDTTFLTLDGSEAGWGSFNTGITLKNGMYINNADGSATSGYLYNDSDDFVIRSYTQDKDIIFKGNDGGSVITPMTIDMSAGGSVGIGTTSPAETLDVSGNALLSGSDGTIRKLTFGATGGNHGSIGVDASGHTFVDVETAGGVLYGKIGGNERLKLQDSGPVMTITEAGTDGYETLLKLYRSSASGNEVGMQFDLTGSGGTAQAVGVWAAKGEDWSSGTSRSATLNFQCKDDGTDQNMYAFGNFSDGVNQHKWLTEGAERMRLDQNGTLLLGTTTAISNSVITVHGGDIMVKGDNNSVGLSDLLSGYTRGDYGVIYSTANHVYFVVGTSYVSYINGGNGTFNVSDQRLKENVATLTGALDKVKQLRGVSFTWKDTEERGTDTAIGLIAQEVETVYPELVDDGALPKDNDGNDPLKSVNYAHLTSVLIEAIKELSTELDAAKARITTLEG